MLLRAPPRTWPRLSVIVHHPIFDSVVMVLIVASVFFLGLEELYQPSEESWVFVVSGVITWIFVAELSLKFVAAKKKRRFFWRYLPDILAVLPILRPLRIFRLLRLFRLFQLGLLLDRRVALLRGVLQMNFSFLWMLLVLTGFVILGGAGVGYVFERSQGEDFGSIYKSLWWATYAVVAGEPIGSMPITTMGRVLLVTLMLAGMILFAVFTGIVSATMMDRLQEHSHLASIDMDELEEHLVVCGWNQGATPLLAELAVDPGFSGQPVVLVNDLERPPDLLHMGIRPELVYHVKGDFTQLDILQRARIAQASRAVVLADDSEVHQRGDRDARSVLAALTIERLQPSIYCVVELMDVANKAHLAVAGVEAVIMRNDLSGRALASACRHPRLATVMMDLLTSRAGARLERVPGPVKRMLYGDLLSQCKAEFGATVLGVETADGQLYINPPIEHLVSETDYLVIVKGGAHVVPHAQSSGFKKAPTT